MPYGRRYFGAKQVPGRCHIYFGANKVSRWCHLRNYNLVPNKCQRGAISEVEFWCQAGSTRHQLGRERRCQSQPPVHQIQVAFWCQAGSLWNRLVGREGTKATLLGTKYKWYFGAKQVPYGSMAPFFWDVDGTKISHWVYYAFIFSW